MVHRGFYSADTIKVHNYFSYHVSPYQYFPSNNLLAVVSFSALLCNKEIATYLFGKIIQFTYLRWRNCEVDTAV